MDEKLSLFPDLMRIPRFMQKSFEWYTPIQYIKAAKEVMGDIDLDPASNEIANNVVQASRFYDRSKDGLTQQWQAKRVWLNPPYCKSSGSSNQGTWSCKLIAEYEAGNIEQAILLVNAATETIWFHRLYNYPICFVKGRIQFNSTRGTKGSPTAGSAFVYFGFDVERFVRVFSRFGVVVRGVTQSGESVDLWNSTQTP